MKKIVVCLVLCLCMSLSGCTSPAELLSYRGGDICFSAAVASDGFSYSAEISLPKDGDAVLTFASPEAEGVSAYLSGGLLYIEAEGKTFPVGEDRVPELSGVLRVISSRPSDIRTVTKTEYRGVPAYRCETNGGGAVYISRADSALLGFSSGIFEITVVKPE